MQLVLPDGKSILEPAAAAQTISFKSPHRLAKLYLLICQALNNSPMRSTAWNRKNRSVSEAACPDGSCAHTRPVRKEFNVVASFSNRSKAQT